MGNIKFRLAAKTDVGMVRTNNEDNFQAAADLANGRMTWVNNQVCDLGPFGALMIVADGMGGMNAGEVASELAVETIKELFSPARITPAVTKTRFSIEKYMNDAITAADERIKAEAAIHPETKGMGTTIVMAWLLDGKLYVSWCGDSRAYVYNPVTGLHQISKDHSYVQTLVDKGSLTRDEAFDFPDSNIITRCLSASPTKAKADSLLKPYEVCNNDIILLCTDGLNGMLRDNEIEHVIRQSEDNMDVLAENLIQAACIAEGSDNITICLCQILEGGAVSSPEMFGEYDLKLNGKTPAAFVKTITGTSLPGGGDRKKRLWWIIGGAVLLLAAIVTALILVFKPSDQTIKKETPANPADTVATPTPTRPPVSTPVPNNVPEEPNPEPEETVETETPGADAGNGIRIPNGIPGPKKPEKVNGSTQASKPTKSEKEILTIVTTTNHTVASGETLTTIAENAGISLDSLMKLNKDLNKNSKLQIGQKIKIPKK